MGIAQRDVAIIGATVGLGIGILLAISAFLCMKLYRKRPNHSSSDSFSDSSTVSSVSSLANPTMELIHETPHVEHKLWFMRRHNHRDKCKEDEDKTKTYSSSSIPRYPYKDIQKATDNFTTILGQGSFGPVYKATMPGGFMVAVKVLASDSSQGEREFQTEVGLLSRLHHRNLVNLVGYCVDKGQRMLIYEFMPNGSLESHLYYNDEQEQASKILSWEERIQIILDVSHGIDYLHEGAVPPVMHRDLKPANILLDQYMRAKVADFGLSKEEVRHDRRKSGLKGTYGYMDPHYMTSNLFTIKSDIYSFGLVMFELITAIHPQQGLEDYINLCSIGGDGNADWEDILDKKLAGKCDLVELGILGDTAYKCLHRNPKKRPSTGDIILAISKIEQRRVNKEESIGSLSGKVATQTLQRIETQQAELRTKTSISQE